MKKIIFGLLVAAIGSMAAAHEYSADDVCQVQVSIGKDQVATIVAENIAKMNVIPLPRGYQETTAILIEQHDGAKYRIPFVTSADAFNELRNITSFLNNCKAQVYLAKRRAAGG